MAASALGAFAWVCALIGVLLVIPAEYPSAGFAGAVAGVSGIGWFLLRPTGGVPR